MSSLNMIGGFTTEAFVLQNSSPKCHLKKHYWPAFVNKTMIDSEKKRTETIKNIEIEILQKHQLN